jgi:prolyl-tRNA editing enzyme YbaK/EbsC (Cys-tRNA(Pro) deacylase)
MKTPLPGSWPSRLKKPRRNSCGKKTGYAIGEVPPVAHVHEPVVFIDQDLQAYSEIWAAAGTPRTVFRITPEKLIEVTGGRVIPVAGKKHIRGRCLKYSFFKDSY